MHVIYIYTWLSLVAAVFLFLMTLCLFVSKDTTKLGLMLQATNLQVFYENFKVFMRNRVSYQFLDTRHVLEAIPQVAKQ